MAKLAAKTYGDALFEEALEKKMLDSVTKEVEAVSAIWVQNKDLQKLMLHPQVMMEEKQEIISSIFEGRISDQLFGFLKVVVQKGRQAELLAIFSYYIARVKNYRHIGVVCVSTPMPLSKKQKDEVRKKILATTDYKALEMHYQEDKSLIGGMVIRIGDRVLDGSVKNQIENLARELKKIQMA